GLDGSFAQWVGEMIPSVKQHILLVTYPGQAEEAIMRLSRVGYDNTIGILEGGFDSWKKAKKEIDTVDRVNLKEFEDISKEKNPLVIDVRKKSEFDSQHLKNAINVPLNEINQHLSQFPKDQFFYVHCAGGYRSMIASSMLKQRGWEKFADIEEGFDGLKESSLELTEYKEPTTML
uniref:rhodanese-like domain-containing protein n=1 Tax=uncultured Eudoraea sp. TaxID=1035614 RepID=UPI0026323BD0